MVPSGFTSLDSLPQAHVPPPANQHGGFADQAIAAAPFAHYSRGLMAGVLRLEGKDAEARELLSERPSKVAEGCAHLIARDAEETVKAFETSMEEDYGLVAGMFTGPFRPWLQQATRWPVLMRNLGLAKQP